MGTPMIYFVSKRNQVFARGGVVVKRLASPEAAAEEAALLRRFYKAGVSVPKLVRRRGNQLVMEFVPGETLPDFLARIENDSDDALLSETARGLCDWLERFYKAVDFANTGEIRGDINGRNFIVYGGHVTGVDFEARAFGSVEQDIGKLLAFIRTYKYAGTRVQRLFSAMFYREAVDRLRLSAPEAFKQYRWERIAMRERRERGGNMI